LDGIGPSQVPEIFPDVLCVEHEGRTKQRLTFLTLPIELVHSASS
jgi:hypothetical protein